MCTRPRPGPELARCVPSFAPPDVHSHEPPGSPDVRLSTPACPAVAPGSPPAVTRALQMFARMHTHPPDHPALPGVNILEGLGAPRCERKSPPPPRAPQEPSRCEPPLGHICAPSRCAEAPGPTFPPRCEPPSPAHPAQRSPDVQGCSPPPTSQAAPSPSNPPGAPHIPNPPFSPPPPHPPHFHRMPRRSLAPLEHPPPPNPSPPIPTPPYQGARWGGAHCFTPQPRCSN